MARNAKKNTLIQEQNKSLFIICGVIIAVIALVGVFAFVSGNSNDQDTKSDQEGVVDDLDAFRKK